MAQQYIKIFDDTVLKQSVNQGYEIQRTNTRLGKFTMGELAFTRDTGRLFVGNFTNLNESNDSEFVSGGILTGNKYLGMIDSKPLTNWNAKFSDNTSEVATSSQFPLSYTVNTTSIINTVENGNIIPYTVEEKALLLSDSKFRTDKNKGWSKLFSYNKLYDAYDGDYIYDAYNNAFIFFDKNIKINDSDVKWITSPNQNATSEDLNYYNQYFQKSDGSYYSETTGDLSSKRTPLMNVDKLDGIDNTLGNPNHPIYGDGYVIMRILEPDGISLGYVEKQFDQTTGEALDGNYSHNYLELKKLTYDALASAFHKDNFNISSDGKVSIKSIQDVNVDKINGSHITLPSFITFDNNDTTKENLKINFLGEAYSPNSNHYNLSLIKNNDNSYRAAVNAPPILSVTNDDKTTRFSLYNGKQFFLNFDKKSDCLFVYEPFEDPCNSNDKGTYNYAYLGNSITNKYGKILSIDEVPEIQIDDSYDLENNEKQPYIPFIRYDSSGSNTKVSSTEEYGANIYYKDKNGNTSTYKSYVVAYEKNELDGEIIPIFLKLKLGNNLKIGYTQDDTDLTLTWWYYDKEDEEYDKEDVSKRINPIDKIFTKKNHLEYWKTNILDEFNKNIDNERYYKSFTYANETYWYYKFEHAYLNTGLNYVKYPQPIAWGTDKYKVKFFTYPFICSPNKDCELSSDGKSYTIIDKLTHPSTNSCACIGSVGISDEADDDGIAGNTWPINYYLNTFEEITGDIEKDSKSYGIQIPSHAQSVICELHTLSSSNYSVVTATDYGSYDDNDNYVKPSFSSIPTDKIPELTTSSNTNYKVLYSGSGVGVNIIEIPLYRNPLGYKFFSFAINTTSGLWVMRAIGYRA